MTYRVTNEFAGIVDQIDWSDLPEPDKMPRKGKFRPPKKVSASGIKDCSRLWFYKLSPDLRDHAREVTKPEWTLAAAYGDWIHNKVQEALIDYDLVNAAEQYLPDRGHFISGRRDGDLTGRKALLEIKTVAGAALAKFPDSEKFLGYMDQIQIYLEELDLPEAVLLCIRRDPIVERRAGNIRKSLCKEFLITRDRAEGQRLIAKALAIQEHVEQRTVPAAEPGDACFFCSFKHLCEIQDVRDSRAPDHRQVLAVG